MQRCPMSLQKVLLAAETLELPPPTTTGIAIGSDIPPSHPAIIGTVGLGTKLRRGVHLARPSLDGRKRRGWKRCWKASLWGLLTGGPARFVGEARKRLGISGAFLRQRGWLARCRVSRGSLSCPPFI